VSKIIVKNTAEHDIVLTKASSKGVVATLTFPAAIQDTDVISGKDVLKASETEVDADELDMVRKDNPVADHYFDEAILRVDTKSSVGSAPAKKTTPQS
jgi:hypothetical protein